MRVFIDSFVEGLYVVRSQSGKRSIHFEDSDQFGPAGIDRHGEPDESHDQKWFWDFYQPWRDAGRPTKGEMSTPFGTLKFAVWPSSSTPSNTPDKG